MLNHLFSSKTRVKLLTLFLKNPQKAYYVRELTRKIQERINSVRRELENLTKLGLISTLSSKSKKQRKKYYQVNDSFILFEELRSLILKAEILSPTKLRKQIEKLGRIKLAMLTKSILQPASREVDLLLVGKISRPRLDKFIKKFQRDQAREINYTVMDRGEFEDRKRLKDGFLEKILANEYMKIV